MDKYFEVFVNIVKLILIAPFVAFACLPDAEFRQKQKTFEAECSRIALAVPCAVGMGEVDREDLAVDKSQRDAIAKLARSVKAFVSYAATDSSWVENGDSQEFSTKVSKINVEAQLNGIQALGSECTEIEVNGKKRFKVITLMALDKVLYAEAQKEVDSEATASSSLSSKSVKSNLKKIAAKSFNVLLSMAKKWVGWPQ